MSVAVNHVSKRYGSQFAVNDISFTVSKGEVLGFLGPNGAGKTTTMRIICGYMAPTAGSVHICGYEVGTQSLKARRCIGYLPENNPLYTDLYVTEFLSFVAALHRVPQARKRIAQIIDLVGLGPECKKKIGALSKGYRQRVGLAQALIHDPEVLILDEPTVGLDPLQLQEIRQLIRELGREKTVILSTHIMQEVKLLCNRVIIISKGQIKADGRLDELVGTGDRGVHLTVTFTYPLAADMLTSVEGVMNVSQKDACTVMIQSAFPNQAQLFAFAMQQHNPIRSIQEAQLDLEEVFRQLTSEPPPAL
ncbi:MAG: ABC transporter ATP-binding protein [Chitinophagales bacterium]|nr:ABC transporter ATP-binding protein [Chitinophagales bacterium]MDW8428686.1 ATP-binding cassette domain-containing protein [Chitinophagales bacterium]